MKPSNRKELWNGGYCELYDAREWNKDLETRVKAVCHIAKVCRNLETIKNPMKLYAQLLTEHNGKASEVLSFIPAKMGYTDKYNLSEMISPESDVNELYSFGYFDFNIEGADNNDFLTNMRTLSNYDDSYNETYCKDAYGFLIFKVKLPWMIVDHMRRHKMLDNILISENWKTNRIFHDPEYYHPDFNKKEDKRFTNFVEAYIKKNDIVAECDYQELIQNLSYSNFREVQQNYKFRKELVAKGEFGLRYTEGFIAGWIQDPLTWKNMFGVRSGSAKGVQKETNELTNVMLEMIPKGLRERYL